MLDPEEAVEICGRIIEKCADLPAEAFEFGDKVLTHVAELALNIENNCACSQRIEAELREIENKVDMWLINEEPEHYDR